MFYEEKIRDLLKWAEGNRRGYVCLSCLVGANHPHLIGHGPRCSISYPSTRVADFIPWARGVLDMHPSTSFPVGNDELVEHAHWRAGQRFRGRHHTIRVTCPARLTLRCRGCLDWRSDKEVSGSSQEPGQSGLCTSADPRAPWRDEPRQGLDAACEYFCPS